MQLPIVTIDAFTDIPFSGNPAAICLLPGPVPEEGMQLIAAEMNLSETAFLEQTGENTFKVRWFTPTREVDICGHATLASAFMLYVEEVVDMDKDIVFDTNSGELVVKMEGDEIVMDFPIIPTKEAEHPYFKDDFFGQKVIGAAALDRNWILELENFHAVEYARPLSNVVAVHSDEGIIITAKGDDQYDIYSRYFAPNLGINEDPVTGFAHCALIDYWHNKNGLENLKAFQSSRREGEMRLEKIGDRVKIYGKAVKIFEGFLEI
ncbi:PhzF family phenazine biosynthesis protein [Echinicola jeungdonensis]|uniref:PhzF family phenazine biosynthesis protein n=1 Tax=Echinicola jeungdonensis TaxID=709343 RepID=A0ABV5J5S1_9BACT|nr:PhzF family phenazine biosynthesis protein [Echinicola jeungdonensis]MDN3670977.1 PhzF family phenazine biosynthesis protein [Echinicola jeungdonensis]